MGSKENYDRDEQKLSNIMSELFSIVCLVRLKEPKVNLVSCIETSKSTKWSSLGSINLQDLMARDAMSICKELEIRFDNSKGSKWNYGSFVQYSNSRALR